MGRRKSRESLRPSSLVPFDLPAASIPNPRHRGDLGRRPLAVQQRAWLRTALPPPDAVMQERELPPLLPYGFTQQYGGGTAEGGRRPSISNTFTHQHPGMRMTSGDWSRAPKRSARLRQGRAPARASNQLPYNMVVQSRL
uniref:Uncharacterized protein n=1 Tax=Leersia perrieri TaxID=77586 RepID=A0A0D9VAC0_9ORYZ